MELRAWRLSRSNGGVRRHVRDVAAEIVAGILDWHSRSLCNRTTSSLHLAMCGIWCALSTRQHVWPSDDTLQLLERRGPDSSCRYEAICERSTSSSQPCYIVFHSTVLSLRGHGTVRQPYRSDGSESTLCWNGEAWKIAGQTQVTGNDTEAVASSLDEVSYAARMTPIRSEAVENQAMLVAKALAEISGPYAFVYHDASNGILFFGRDFLGRRSLLTLTTADGDLLISSVAGEQCKSEDPPWFEVEADGVYYVDLYADILVRKVPYHFADMNTEESTLSVGLPDASELL